MSSILYIKNDEYQLDDPKSHSDSFIDASLIYKFGGYMLGDYFFVVTTFMDGHNCGFRFSKEEDARMLLFHILVKKGVSDVVGKSMADDFSFEIVGK